MNKHDHRGLEHTEANGYVYKATPEGKHILPTSIVKAVFADRTRDTRTASEIASGKLHSQFLSLLVEETAQGETILHPQKEPEE